MNGQPVKQTIGAAQGPDEDHLSRNIFTPLLSGSLRSHMLFSLFGRLGADVIGIPIVAEAAEYKFDSA